MRCEQLTSTRRDTASTQRRRDEYTASPQRVRTKYTRVAYILPTFRRSYTPNEPVTGRISAQTRQFKVPNGRYRPVLHSFHTSVTGLFGARRAHHNEV